MIKQIMTAQRIPVDRVFRQKVKAEWKRDAYREVNTKFLQLRNYVFDLRLQSSFSTRKTESSDPTRVSATATGRAVDGTYDIEVTQLATSAELVSNAEDGASEVLSRIFSESELEEFSLAFKGLDGSAEVLRITKSDTMETIAAKISSNKNLGITAFWDSFNDQIVLTTKATGESAAIEVSSSTDELGREFLSTLFGETLAFSPEEEFVAIGESGTNAKFTINGLTTERESNTFEINGINITLHRTTGDGESVRITVQRDVDAVVEKIKGFVDLYNETIAELNLKLREPVNRSYEPLTDAEREELSEKEIERWEEAAKSGLLRSDPIISGILSNLRMAISEANLSRIGIKTGSWQEYGRLHLDETKLREALLENPDDVMGMFTYVDESGENIGLAGKLTRILDEGMERIVSTAGKASMPFDTSYLGEQIRQYESRLEAMEERLARVENRYWNQFTAMERALSELYAQSDWLYQQLLALQG